MRTLQTLRLAILFATIYVVEGIIEPTTGVVAEPVKSLLKHWGETPVEIASFLAMLGSRLPLLVRANIGILGGVVSSLAYLSLGGERDLYAISLVSGFTYMLGGLALIDLAARACATDASGTVYAVFMAVCNLRAALATWLRGYLHSGFTEAWGSTHGFHAFAVCGAIVTGACWAVFPKVPWRELAGGSQGA